MFDVPLSVLDLAPVPSGSSSTQALRNSIDLARRADALGYTRYWMAEHHNMASVVSSAPEILLGVIATQTEQIRVGSGGIMLPNHAPLKVAENFRTLEALAPGRIDLGIGRAPGSDPMTALALRRSSEAMRAAEDLPALLAELEAFTQHGFPQGHPFAGVQAAPMDVPLPPVWLLGSSLYSARLAARQGRGFAFAYHFSAEHAEPALRLYREEFTPSATLERPHAILAVSVVCAPTEAQADHLATTLDLSFLNIRRGVRQPLPSPEEALAYPYSDAERAFVQEYRASQVIGTPAQVRARLTWLAQRLGADELMLTSNIHAHAARLQSYALVAQAFQPSVTPA